MGFRFHRSIALLPGIRLNLNKGMPSVSLGARGARININRRGIRSTTGVPGTGLSYITHMPWPRQKRAGGARQPAPAQAVNTPEALIAALAPLSTSQLIHTYRQFEAYIGVNQRAGVDPVELAQARAIYGAAIGRRIRGDQQAVLSRPPMLSRYARALLITLVVVMIVVPAGLVILGWLLAL